MLPALLNFHPLGWLPSPVVALSPAGWDWDFLSLKRAAHSAAAARSKGGGVSHRPAPSPEADPRSEHPA